MKKNLDIYTDKLNFKTLIIIFYYFFLKKKKIRVFFYTIGLSFPFFKQFKFSKNIKLIDITSFHESRFFINNKSLFNLIWIEIENFLNEQIKNYNLEKLEEFNIEGNKVDKKKLLKYFKENSTFLVYYQIKLYVFSKKFSNSRECIFFIKSNPFNNELKKFYDINIFNYFDFTFFYKKRIDGYFYENFLTIYLYTRLKIIQNIFFSINQFILGFLCKKDEASEKKIFIEVHQREINLNSITDLFWLKNSKLKKKSIAILYKDYDQNSINELSKNNINYKYSHKLHVSKKMFRNLIRYYLLIFINLLNFNLENFKKIMMYFYFIKTSYWYEVFKNENAKIFFTMIDADEDKFCKINAIELNGGLSITSHWSNFPFFLNRNNKAANVILSWGDHFKKFILTNENYNKIYNIGYPNDHYFDNIEKKFSKIESKDKFVLTYMDNNLFSDGFYPPNLNRIIVKNFIKLLNKHENLLIYLKPKDKSSYKKEYPCEELAEFIKQDRLKVFFGESKNEKYNPAAAAAMSDLCVGLGISTASAEATFYGVPAFHFDNQFIINDFTKIGKNKIIFNSVEELIKNVELQIKSKKISIEECRKISYTLDCFQDRNSSKRAEIIISYIYESLVNNENHNNLLNNLDQFIKENTYFKENISLLKNLD